MMQKFSLSLIHVFGLFKFSFQFELKTTSVTRDLEKQKYENNTLVVNES